MSLLNSLFSGVSGMKNHQAQMDVVGNNIANVNTIGFKGSRVTFSDTFNQFIRYGSDPTTGNGGTNTFQVGLGMKLNSVDRNWNQGTFERTGITTDLALQGDALFILENNGEQFYSRAGAFNFDANGNLVNPQNGAIVQGKMATEDGIIPAGNSLEAISINLNQKLPAVATTEVNWVGNLNSKSNITRTEEVVQNGNLDSDLADMAIGALSDSEQVVIYDEDGTEYHLISHYVKTAANTYDFVYDIYTDKDDATTSIYGAGAAAPQTISDFVFDTGAGNDGELLSVNGSAVDLTAGSAFLDELKVTKVTDISIDFSFDPMSLAQSTSSTSVSSIVDGGRDPNIVNGTVTVYDSQGEAHSITIKYTKTGVNQWNWNASISAESGTLTDTSGSIEFAKDGSILVMDPGTPTIVFDPDGAQKQKIELKFGEISGFNGITQTSSDSVISVEGQNGSAAAQLSNVNIDLYGNIVGVFSNGTTRDLAQIMLASFRNLNGLTSVGENMYQVSSNTGSVLVTDPGEASGTTIQSGALEQSNVDLSEEFTKMIVAQRGFQANARVITTSDSLLQEITNLVR